jgi:hypothetical protein
VTLNEIEQDLYRRLGFNTSTPDTATQTRLRAFINETQREILSEPGMESLLYDTITFPSVASTPTYSIPPAIAKIRNVYDTTNLIKLAPRSLGWYRGAYPSPTLTTGLPDSYVELGNSAVAVQPSNASELFTTSSAGGDSTKRLHIEGYITGGYYMSATADLTALTGAAGAVSFGATITTWIEITKFYLTLSTGLTAIATGNITLLEDSGAGTELARIPIGQSYATYKKIALAPCPSSAVTYTVDFQRDVQDMAFAPDQPLLPERFHRLLGIGARMREYEKQDQPRRYAQAQAEYLYGLKKLKFFLYSQAVGSPNLRGGQTERPSQLGGQYPAGS